ncbi:MAG: beta-N-acetylhexosaminidase [Phocaeicola sp.]
MRFYPYSILTLLLSFILTLHPLSAQQVHIIPKPSKVELTNGKGFTINAQTKIVYAPEFKEQAELLASFIYAPTAMKLSVSEGEKASANSIHFVLDSQIENKEGYTVDVTNKGVIIKGKSAAGAFYGIQTLLQLLPPQVESDRLLAVNLTLPAISISDAPTFEWRGAMLDVARYFFHKEFILQYIDMMAMYKLNALHLHLIDDSGWRLEIKKYPLLTEIGAFGGTGENRTGGFYTQDDIREIVAYATARGVDVIPEFAFPAHFMSAVAAYPWLSCREESVKVQTQHYISKDLLCAGKESSIQFLNDVIDEVCQLFPSKYLHIGGDEAVYDYWSACPHCQKVMEKEGLNKSEELQSYLTNVVAKKAATYGRTVVGWDEILERGKVNEQVVSMIWRNMKNLDHVFNLGHKAILCPANTLYFDFPESGDPSEIKAATWLPPISVEKCYNFETAAFEGNSAIVGLQVAMWSDQFIHGTILQELALLDENRSERYIEYLMLPRMLAFGELAWTKSSDRNFTDFSNRLLKHYARLDYAGYTYRIPTPEVKQEKVADGYLITASTPIEGTTVHYTTNGERPSPYDKLYTEPVKVAQLSDFRAVAARTKSHHSVPSYFADDYSAYKQYGRFVHKFQHAQLASEMSVTLTGFISGDGDYELTFIPITDGVEVELEKFDIFKRNELSATADPKQVIKEQPVTSLISISEWQAGTPYSAKINVKVGKSNRGNVALFIRKL